MSVVHLSTRAGNPACRTPQRAPRLASNVTLVTCVHCSETTAYSSALRYWLRRQIRRERAEQHSGAMGGVAHG